jgi:hypothetical protein
MAEIETQPIEYLAVSETLLNDPTTGEQVVVITIRPVPPNWFSVNLALSTAQAGRLLADLQNLLIPFGLVVGVLLAATVGCGAKVEVESATWNSPSSEPKATTGEKARTMVEVDLLQTRPPEVVAKADPPAAKMPEPPPPPKPVALEVKPINISGNTFVLNYRAGDVTYRSDVHVHLHEPPRVEERIVIHREVETKPRRPVEDPCDRGQKEHEERVRRWREFPGRY